MDEDWAEDSVEDTFTPGDMIVLTTRTEARAVFGNVELGLFVGANDDGIIFRRTHKRAYKYDEHDEPALDADGEHDWYFKELNRTILTFVSWRMVDRFESQEDISQDVELNDFADAMAEVEPTDFAITHETGATDNA